MTNNSVHAERGSLGLDCSGIGLAIGGAVILDDIDLAVRRGEFVGMIGPNGAGKTSLLNVITGTMRHTSGQITFAEQDISSWPVHRRARAGVGRTFQSSYLLNELTVLENVRLVVQARTARPRHALRRVVPDDALVSEAMRSLDKVGLAAKALVAAGTLSHGEKRKVELAMVLASNAQLILLDEPMAGVNADDVESLVDVIRDLHTESGATTIMVEHHMAVVLGLADRVAVLHHGSLLAFSTATEVMADERVQSAYLGDPL